MTSSSQSDGDSHPQRAVSLKPSSAKRHIGGATGSSDLSEALSDNLSGLDLSDGLSKAVKDTPVKRDASGRLLPKWTDWQKSGRKKERKRLRLDVKLMAKWAGVKKKLTFDAVKDFRVSLRICEGLRFHVARG